MKLGGVLRHNTSIKLDSASVSTTLRGMDGRGGGGKLELVLYYRNVCSYANYSNWRGKDRSTEETKSDFFCLCKSLFDIFFLNGY